MILNIKSSTTFKDLQDQFRKEYPFLKICFSDISHEFGEAVRRGHWYDPSMHLSAVVKGSLPHVIEIQPWLKTGDVEQAFREIKLYAQVFRWEDDRWIETAGTDVLSLDEQNQIGLKSAERRSGNLWIEREIVL
ncbi:MAG: hypothetical protein ACM3VS_08670 [Candidatus Dadabacteria bacterium]